MTKTCKICNKIKPIDQFHLHKSMKDGHDSKCKKCHNIACRQWEINNSKRRREIARKSKIKHMDARREYDRKYEKDNADYIRERKNKHRAKNIDRFRKKDAAYYLKNKDFLSAKEKEYRKNNPILCRLRALKRRAAKKLSIPIWYDDFDDFVFEEAEILRRERQGLTGIKWHIDHIVPLQSKIVCGLHSYINVAVIPAIENQRKLNNYWPDMPTGAVQ